MVVSINKIIKTRTMNEDSGNVKKGDIVWAKVKGFPWWPGEVKRVSRGGGDDNNTNHQKMIMVNFIGHKSHIDLPLNKIENFENKFESYSKTRNKTLLKSIEKAKRLSQLKKKSLARSQVENNQSDSSEQDESIGESENNKRILKSIKINEPKITDLDKITSASTFAGSSKTKPKNIKINININVTNNNHNTVNISSFSKDASTMTTIKNKKNIKNNEKNEHTDEDKISNSEDSNGYEENENDEHPEETLKQLFNNLLKYQIEMTTSSSLKYVVNTMEEIKELLLKYPFPDLYTITKDIIPLLMSFTYNKNSDIFVRSSEILSSITQKIVDEVFDIKEGDNILLVDPPTFSKEDKHEMMLILSRKRGTSSPLSLSQISSYEIDNNNYKPRIKTSTIFTSMTKKKTKRKFSENDNDNNFKEIFDAFNKVIAIKDTAQAMKEMKNQSQNFFLNSYNKLHGLEIKSALKRKNICLKMYKLLKKIFTKANDKDIKEMVIYFEFLVRRQDPCFGKKYSGQIKKLINSMINVLIEKNDFL